MFTFDALLKYINHACNIMSKCIFAPERLKNIALKRRKFGRENDKLLSVKYYSLQNFRIASTIIKFNS